MEKKIYVIKFANYGIVILVSYIILTGIKEMGMSLFRDPEDLLSFLIMLGVIINSVYRIGLMNTFNKDNIVENLNHNNLIDEPSFFQAKIPSKFSVKFKLSILFQVIVLLLTIFLVTVRIVGLKYKYVLFSIILLLFISELLILSILASNAKIKNKS